MLDHKLKPYILEVNHSPSFTADSPFDVKIKGDLLTDTIKLIHLKYSRRLKFYNWQKKLLQQRMQGKKNDKLSKEERNKLKEKKMAKRDNYEKKHLGGFTQIYPSEGYDEFLKEAMNLWEEFYGTKKILPKKDDPKPKRMNFGISETNKKLIEKKAIMTEKPTIQLKGKPEVNNIPSRPINPSSNPSSSSNSLYPPPKNSNNNQFKQEKKLELEIKTNVKPNNLQERFKKLTNKLHITNPNYIRRSDIISAESTIAQKIEHPDASIEDNPISQAQKIIINNKDELIDTIQNLLSQFPLSSNLNPPKETKISFPHRELLPFEGKFIPKTEFNTENFHEERKEKAKFENDRKDINEVSTPVIIKSFNNLQNSNPTIGIIRKSSAKDTKNLNPIRQIKYPSITKSKERLYLSRIYMSGKYIIPKILDFCPKVGLSPMESSYFNKEPEYEKYKARNTNYKY